MGAPRVTSEFWISAYKKVLESQAIPIFVVQKGDSKAGAIIVRISDLKGMSKIFVQSYDLKGERQWIELAAGTDLQMDDLIVKQKEVDTDLWVLDVETRNGCHYLDAVSF